MNRQFRFAIVSCAAAAMLSHASAPSWAQDNGAFEKEARAVRERMRFVRQMESLLRAAEEARLRGACHIVAAYHAQFQTLNTPPGSGVEFVADLKRRMWEIALRDCPPGSGKPSVAPPPAPPAPTPTPVPPVVLPEPPAPVGSAGAAGGSPPPGGAGQAPPKGLPPAGGTAPTPTAGEPAGTDETILDYIDEVDRAEWERRKAEREARLKRDAAQSGAGAAAPPRSQPQGLSEAEQRSLAARMEEAQTAEQTVRDLEDDWLSWESRVSIAKRFRETLINDKKFPPDVMERWVERLDDVLEKAPPETKAAPGLQSSAPNLSPFAREMLAAHNAARHAVGAPALRWDPALEASAIAHARTMAAAGQLIHAPREGRGIERENLSSAPMNYSVGQMVQRWSDEKRHFVRGTFPDVSTTGNWSDVAHYTQMVWPTTTSIGCGTAPDKGFRWLVCRYSPGGNKDGKPVG